jgi:hypothetical protein
VSGWAGWAGLLAGKKKKGPVGQKRAEMKKGGEREGEGEERVLFFLNSFKFIFQTFKLQSNKNPCIQIMMHKHLLSLNYFSDV